MNCINCGSSDTSVFYKEKIPCSHCNEVTEVIYEACAHCYIMWKSVDGEVIDNSFDVDQELDKVLSDGAMVIDGNLFDEFPTDEEFEDLLRSINFMDTDSVKSVKSMRDMVHRCLRCDTVSYEIKPRLYHCPDCGFEWEVL